MHDLCRFSRGVLPWRDRSRAIPRFDMVCAALIVGLAATGRVDAEVIYPEFNDDNSTEAVQAALDNLDATEVVLTLQSGPWIVDPLFFTRDCLILTLEPGVVLQASPGYGGSDKMIRIFQCTDITIRGYGATIRMLRDDEGYLDSEQRHAIDIRSSIDVDILGVTIRDTGGDGISVSAQNNPKLPYGEYCDDVDIIDVTCINCMRNGIAVISGQNVTIAHCFVADTNGWLPEAGIKLEPNNNDQRLVNVLVDQCTLTNNAGLGVAIGTPKLTAEAETCVSVTVRNCWVTSSGRAGIRARMQGMPGVQQVCSTVSFTNILVENVGTAPGGDEDMNAAFMIQNQAVQGMVAMKNCVIRNAVPIDSLNYAPIWIDGVADPVYMYGGVTFTDCVVYDSLARPYLRCKPNPRYRDIVGNVTIINPNSVGATASYPADTVNFAVTVNWLAANPPSVVTVNAIDGDSEGSEIGPDEIDLRVKRSSPNMSFPLAVTYALSHSTAVNGDDFAYLNGLTIIPKALVGKTVTITPRADSDPTEGTETVEFGLSSSTYYSLGSAAHVVTTITDSP